jgi:hypothetical protein
MTGGTQNRAGRYMQKVMETITDDTPPERAMEILHQCNELADKDFAECNTSKLKQKVWVAQLSALQIVIHSQGGDGVANHALREALINSSLGRPGAHDLKSSAISNTQSIDKEWVRACVIALIDEYPESRHETLKDGGKILSLSESSIKKMRENYRAGNIGGKVLENLVRTAQELIKENGYTNLSDLFDH